MKAIIHHSSNSKRKYPPPPPTAPAVWDGKTTCDLTPAPRIGSTDAQAGAGADTAPPALRGRGCYGCIDLDI